MLAYVWFLAELGFISCVKYFVNNQICIYSVLVVIGRGIFSSVSGLDRGQAVFPAVMWDFSVGEFHIPIDWRA